MNQFSLFSWNVEHNGAVYIASVLANSAEHARKLLSNHYLAKQGAFDAKPSVYTPEDDVHGCGVITFMMWPV